MVILKDKVVVSLTTTIERLQLAREAIRSLLRQTHQPEKIILNFDKKFIDKKKEINVALFGQLEPPSPVMINYCNDVGPHTKLLPTLHLVDCEKAIITIDDDVIYNSRMVENFLVCHNETPNLIICARGRIIKKYSILNSYKRYEDWPNVVSEVEGKNILALGVGGVLYPNIRSDYSWYTDPNLRILSPKADDLSFKAAQMISGLQVRCVPELALGNEYIKHQFGIEEQNRSEDFFSEENILNIKKIFIRKKITLNDIQWRQLLCYIKKLR